MKDVTKIFEKADSRLIKAVLGRGGVVLGTRLENFSGVLTEDKIYAESLAKKVESKTGVKGYISTDELPAYGISRAERDLVKAELGAKENDVVILVVDDAEKAKKALSLIEKEMAARMG